MCGRTYVEYESVRVVSSVLFIVDSRQSVANVMVGRLVGNLRSRQSSWWTFRVDEKSSNVHVLGVVGGVDLTPHVNITTRSNRRRQLLYFYFFSYTTPDFCQP